MKLNEQRGLKMNLQELIDISSKKKDSVSLYTSSKHITAEASILEGILEENPDWADTIQALSMYSAQKWAQNTRNKLNLSVVDEKYIGIPLKNKTAQIQALNSSTAILDIIEASIEKLPKKYKDILSKIYLENGDVSKYMVDQYYETAIKKLCATVGQKITKEFKKVHTSKNDLENDIQFVCQDIHRLMDLKSDIRYFDYYDGHEVDFAEFYDNFTQIVESLCQYTLKDYVYECTSRYLNKESDLEIAHKTGKSNTFIRSRYKLGMKLISFVLWGYAC